jgi:glyoxylase I family protein
MTQLQSDLTSGATTGPPALAGLHHIGITVTDLARSVRWYAEMLGLVQWMEETYPGGRTACLMRPGTSVHIGLDAHDANAGEPFAPHRTGLDHLALTAASRGELEAWHAYLSGKGVACGGIKAVLEPFAYELFTFADPDGVALEIIHMGGE